MIFSLFILFYIVVLFAGFTLVTLTLHHHYKVWRDKKNGIAKNVSAEVATASEK